MNEGEEVKISDETTHTTTPSVDDESKMQKIITRSMVRITVTSLPYNSHVELTQKLNRPDW